MQKNTKEVISALVTLNYKIITSKYFLSVETLWYQRKHVSPAFLYVHRRMNFFLERVKVFLSWLTSWKSYVVKHSSNKHQVILSHEVLLGNI